MSTIHFIQKTICQKSRVEQTLLDLSQNKIMIAKKKGKQTRNQWTDEENIFYVKYLKNFRKRYSKKTHRRLCKYEQMATFIETKTSSQCRSHHQKMLLKFGSVQQIIEQISLDVAKKNIKSSEIFEEQVKMIEECSESKENKTMLNQNQNPESSPQQTQSELARQNFEQQSIFDVLV